jgi:phosphoglycolate phosphatase
MGRSHGLVSVWCQRIVYKMNNIPREDCMRNDGSGQAWVVLFDIDGTLLASGGAGKLALEEALLHEFQLEAIRLQVPYSGRTDVAIARDLLRGHDLQAHPEHVERLHEAYLRRLPEALVRRQGNVLPGVLELLQALRCRQDVLVGLLTGNIRRGAAVKLGHFGIHDYFAFGGFGDGLLERDEVARAAWQAAEAHHGGGLLPERTWVIGDTPLDVQCARAIGAKAAAVATGFHTLEELAACQPDLLLKSLAEGERLWERMRAFAVDASPHAA